MSSLERYAEYDPLAWFYNKHWDREYHPRVMPVMEKLLLPLLPEEGHILDLCCGTGHFARMLSEKGFRVTGIDGSGEMIKYARMNAPECRFIIADARSFNLPASFHLALSTFESLNHIMDIAGLEKVFANVHSCLLPGGFFFFDLLSEDAYESLWGGVAAYIEEESACVLRGGFEKSTGMARSEITMFRLDGNWTRSDLVLNQRCHPLEEIPVLLKRAGFSEVRVLDAGDDLGITGNMGQGRKFFLARRG